MNTDLGVVSSGKNKNEVEVTVPTEERDIDAAYEDAIHVLSTKPPKAESKPDPQTEQEDYYRSFRTKCVFFFRPSLHACNLAAETHMRLLTVFFSALSVRLCCRPLADRRAASPSRC